MPQTLKTLFQKGKIAKIKKGNVFITPESNLTDLYYLQKGYVMVYQRSDVGKKVFFNSKPGEIFPLALNVLQQKNSFYFEALTDIEVLALPKTTLLKAINSNLSLSKEVIVLLSNYLTIYVDRVSNLEIPTARERLTSRLSFFAKRFGRRTDAGILLEIPMTHQFIADSINLTRETVSRELKKLQKEKVITFSGRKLLIKKEMLLVAALHIPFLYTMVT